MDLTSIVVVLKALPAAIKAVKDLIPTLRSQVRDGQDLDELETKFSELETKFSEIEDKLACIESVARAIKAYKKIAEDSSMLSSQAKGALKMIEYTDVRERNAPLVMPAVTTVFHTGLNSNFENYAPDIEEADAGNYRGHIERLNELVSEANAHLESGDYDKLEEKLRALDNVAISKIAGPASSKTGWLIGELEYLVRGR